jgi:tRNA(Ile)-lysidine synthase TilS/MesJ
MNPGYNKENIDKIIDNAKHLNIPITIFESNIFEVIKETKGNSPCYLCARMRRGCLYSKAQELGCNKIALGHHFDEVIETTLLSMFYGSEIKTMMPKVISQNFEGMELIRPLYYVKEDSIIKWANHNNLTFIRCACRFTENVADGEMASKRQEVKNLLAQLKKSSPNIDINILQSTKNVNVDTLIGYKEGGNTYEFLDIYKDRKLNKKYTKED